MNRKIYVMCPADFKTGGTELLHQLVHGLNIQGQKAYIVYYDGTSEKNINPSFKKYVSTYLTTQDIEDEENNILVLPEIITFYIDRFKNIKKFLWWESVDSYLLRRSVIFCAKQGLYKYAAKALQNKISKNNAISINRLKEFDLHLCQSQYSIDFLNGHGVNNIKYLSDYINDLYVSEMDDVDISNKEDLVCFNPKKGIKFTKGLIGRKHNVKFVPIINMSNEEVRNLLKKAKVYIDFGEHPGKDRVPREAASMGCCVITGKKGSAKYFEDIPIPSMYKFDDKTSQYDRILHTISDIFENYEKHYNNYNEYREMIKGEKNRFEKDIERIFAKT